MGKIDLKKKFKHLYLPSAKEVTLVEVPAFQFILIDGCIRAEDRPETSPEFRETMEALYGLSYTLKFMSKLRPESPIDYTVMALEGLWGSEEADFEFDYSREWPFTMMIMQPDHITGEMVEEARRQVAEKRPNPALERARFERFHEGLSVQIMHLGPYAEETPTIEKMHDYAAGNGYRLRGRHHEIYIGDPRRAKPENLKTVLRHPVEPVG